MGQKDTAVRLYLKNPAIFADACNYALFGGEDVIKPESLKEQDTSQIAVLVSREMEEIIAGMERAAGKAIEADNESRSSEDTDTESGSSEDTDTESGSREEADNESGSSGGTATGGADVGEEDKRKDNVFDRVKKRLKKIVPDKYVDRFRDIYKEAAIMSDGKTTYALIGIEAQTDPDREMAIRIMLADALSYATQAQHIQDLNHATGKLGRKNYISGLLPGDRIRPVITLVVLFSDEGWNVPRSLSELFEDYDTRLAPYIQDYHLNLIVPSEIENFDWFHSNLGLLMQIMETVKDRERLREVLQERQAELDELDVNAARVLGLYTGIEAGQLEKIGKEGSGVSMSKYWKAFIDGEIQDGIEKGLEERVEKELDQRVEKELDQRVEKELDQRVEKELDQRVEKEVNLRVEEKEKKWESERITLASENSNLMDENMRLREQLARFQAASV